jgi:biopolymer transport protein ExbD
MAGSASTPQDVISEINIVPLVDIILVVLIIFMVTASTFSSKEIDVQLPKASTGSSSSTLPFTVQVSPNGQMYLNGAEVNDESLRAQALERVASDPESTAVISADAAAAHGVVVRVMDLLQSAGLTKLAVSVEGSP